MFIFAVSKEKKGIKVMAWLYVTEDGTEFIAGSEPKLKKVKVVHGVKDMPWKTEWNGEYREYIEHTTFHCVKLKKGTIKKLIGRELKFKDKPVSFA